MCTCIGVHIGMYVCMSIGVHIGVYVVMYIGVHIGVYVCISIWQWSHYCLYTHIHTDLACYNARDPGHIRIVNALQYLPTSRK